VRIARTVLCVASCAALLLLPGCREQEPARPHGWSSQTHNRKAAPDYGAVFPVARVLRLDIRIDAADWSAMLADMTDMLGEFGSGPFLPGGPLPPSTEPLPPGGPPLGGAPIVLPDEAYEACATRQQGDACSVTTGYGPPISGICLTHESRLACAPPTMGGDPIGDDGPLDHTPVWKPVQLTFNGRPWNHVGMRFKGNSTLVGAWTRGIYKLPFRLSFDHFEAEHPEIRNQRFFGFQRLSFTNNETDPSFLREKITTDLLREHGVPAAHAAHVRVYIDTGSGPVYFGLYTMNEIPDDPLLTAQMGGAGGNLYKPDGATADWTSFAQEDFQKESNAGAGDWSDIQQAIAALHSSRADAASWRAGLERHLDVPGFLRWLAANSVMANSDTYGALAHNYYLYGVPGEGGRLHWIPWDHDLSLSGQNFDVMHSGTGTRWPLIRFLLDDPVYRAQYIKAVREFLDGPFAVNNVQPKLNAAHLLIAPYVTGAEGELPLYTALRGPEEFVDALSSPQGLLSIVARRHAEVLAQLATQP
jgi:spore coat protein H